MIILYIRHGEPIYHPDSLTEQGKVQAELLAERFKNIKIDKIYASSSNRAMQTAEPTAKVKKLPIISQDWMREDICHNYFFVLNDQGKWRWLFSQTPWLTKMNSLEVYQAQDKWYEVEGLNDPRFKQGVEFYKENVHKFLKELGYEWDEEKRCYKVIKDNDEVIAIFAHQGFGMAFMSTLLGIPYPLYASHFNMHYTGITEIDFKNRDGICFPRVEKLSDDGHLFIKDVGNYID